MKTEKIERLTKYYKDQGFSERRLKNRIVKEEMEEQQEKNQKPIKEITIAIEWKKSYTWGFNPAASAKVIYQDGTYYNDSNVYRASGCGYDKESTVIAQVFNQYLKYKLWEIEDTPEKIIKKPYGIRLSFDYSPYYESGVGTNCYYDIAEFIGGEFKHITGGKTFDVYQFNMREDKNDEKKG